MGFFSSVPLALSSPGAQEWLPPRLPFLRAYRARVTEHSQGPFLSCGSCHTRGRKRELQASDACLSGLPFPLQTPKCGVGPGPMPSGTLGAAGGYFCSQAGQGTRAQLPRAFLCVGLHRRSEVRAEQGRLRQPQRKGAGLPSAWPAYLLKVLSVWASLSTAQLIPKSLWVWITSF